MTREQEIAAYDLPAALAEIARLDADLNAMIDAQDDIASALQELRANDETALSDALVEAILAAEDVAARVAEYMDVPSIEES